MSLPTRTHEQWHSRQGCDDYGCTALAAEVGDVVVREWDANHTSMTLMGRFTASDGRYGERSDVQSVNVLLGKASDARYVYDFIVGCR